MAAQECPVHEDLSLHFNFRVQLTYSEESNRAEITVTVIDKSDPESIQTVKLDTEGFYADSFSDCKEVRSYSTHVNDTLASGDENDSGNLIVADFNFDGLEDFAIKCDPGGNGGPIYEYYLQESDKKFHKSDYLSKSMMFFPIEINAEKNTLTTLVHANSYQKERQVFKYKKRSKKWKVIFEGLE
jgi:hypothetical protein